MDTNALMKTNIPPVLFAEIKGRLIVNKQDQTIYIWELSADEQEYSYVICNTVEAMPDIVTEPFLSFNVPYKGTPS